MKAKKIYVAGKYSADNILAVLENIRVGTKACAAILKSGHVPFCPWLDYQFHFYEPTLTVADYQRYSMEWLKCCDEVFVLNGWERSKGTRAEIDLAIEMDIPIIFEDDQGGCYEV